MGDHPENDRWPPEIEPLADVRQAVMALLEHGQDLTVDDVPWDEYQHAYGTAQDVPGLLAAVQSRDEKRATEALGTLWNNVRHQGGSSPAAALAVPFLVRAAADAAVHNRGRLLCLAAQAGHGNHFGGDMRTSFLQVGLAEGEERYDNHGGLASRTLTAGRTALTACADSVTALLDDADADVRANAAYAAATVRPDSAPAPAQLLAWFDSEQDPAVRISLVLAATQLAVEAGDLAGAATRATGLWQPDAHPADVRFGAALAWLCVITMPAPPRLLELLWAAATPQMAQILGRVPWQHDLDRYRGLAEWLVVFLEDDPAGQSALVSQLARTPDADTTVSACDAAHRLSAARRSATPALIELLVDQLASGLPGIGLHSARLLARTGAACTPHVDTLVEHLDRHPDAEMRAWLVTTLAHCGDPRAAEPLAELFTRAEPPWPQQLFDPQPQRLLDQLRPHAATLIPGVCEYLERAGATGTRDPICLDLVRGLATWESDAAEAMWTLIPLHGTEGINDAGAIAVALGRIGPAAEPAVLYLDAFVDSAGDNTDPAAVAALLWARWRITAEQPDQTAQRLAVIAAIPPHGPRTLQLLADMGPFAAAAETSVRAINPGWYVERLELAHALCRITRDHITALPVYMSFLSDDADAGYPSDTLTVVAEYLGELGPAAASALPYLTELRHTDRRVRWGGLRHDAISADERHLAIVDDAIRSIRQ